MKRAEKVVALVPAAPTEKLTIAFLLLVAGIPWLVAKREAALLVAGQI